MGSATGRLRTSHLNRFWIGVTPALGLAGLLSVFAGCSDDTDAVPKCIPACGAGYTCFHGVCIKQDGGVTDMGPVKPDLKQSPDLPVPDMKQAMDTTQPDMKQTVDTAQPDQTQPDMPMPDMMQPDMPTPMPDMMQPDMPTPMSDMPMPMPDMAPADYTMAPPDTIYTTCAQIMGKVCTKSGSQCGTGGTCLLTSSDGTSGVCTCTCMPDNSSTPLVNEDTCPGAGAKTAVCGSISLTGGSKVNYCFKTCIPKLGVNDCNSTLYCHPRSGAAIGQYSVAVCLYHGGCTKNADCPVTNGKACDTKTNQCTGAGETCQALTTGGTAGMCAVAGKCDLQSRLCGQHTLGKAAAKVGDPCKSDLECAGNQSCFIEFDEKLHLQATNKACTSDGECCSGSCSFGYCAAGAPCRTRNRNGYCTTAACLFSKTLTHATCDSTSVCNTLYSGGICQKSCDMKTASDCRGYSSTSGTVVDYLGDYECRAWNNLSIGGVTIVSKSVCDFGHTMPCDMLANSTLDCSSVGLTSNPTNMTCRGTKNKIKTNKYDPTGLCLDNTAAGSVKP